MHGGSPAYGCSACDAKVRPVAGGIELAAAKARLAIAEAEAARLRAALERLYLATALVLYPEGGHVAPGSASTKEEP